MLLLQLILILIVLFGLIIFALKKLFYNDFSKAQYRLSELNEQNLEKEKLLKNNLEEAEQKGRHILEESLAEAKRIKDSAINEVSIITKTTKEAAEKEKEHILSRAKEEVEKIKSELLLKMNKKSVNLACEMVKALLSDGANDRMNSQFIEELIDEISGIEDGRIDIHVEEGKVISPFPVGDEQKKRLEDVIKNKSGKNISLIEEIDEELIMGMKVNIDGLLIDGSLKNKLEKIQKSGVLLGV